MKPFMQTHHVYLTPISPIHIGCGEDFEPTNYVLDNNVLYHFDPLNLELSEEQKKELIQLIDDNKGTTLEIQRFFRFQKEKAKKVSKLETNVSRDIVYHWEDRFKNKNNKSDGIFYIERTSYSHIDNQAYVPSSSLKGALATAIIDSLYSMNKDTNDLLELYIGTFDNSNLRGVKFSDLTPNQGVNTKVLYVKNYYKEPENNKSFRSDLDLMREFITPRQYRAFKGDVSLWHNLESKKKRKLDVGNIESYISYLNKYNLKIFREEMNMLFSNKLIKKEDLDIVNQILNSNRQVALIRLGRSGAESKTVRLPNVAQIEIKKKKKENSYKSDHATTIWLASDNKDKVSDLYPLGWAILEFDPVDDNLLLKQWCESKSNFLAIDNRRKFLQLEKEKAEKQKNEEKANRLAQLNKNQFIVVDFVDRVKNEQEKRHYTNSNLYKEAKEILTDAMDWNEEDKKQAVEMITLDLLSQKIDFNDKSKKEFNKLRNKLVNN